AALARLRSAVRRPPWLLSAATTPTLPRLVTGQRTRAARRTERPSSLRCVRRRPTLPRSGPRSTIGAERLSFRVRDGTGRFPLAMVAETLWRCGPHRRLISRRGPYLGNRTVDALRIRGRTREKVVFVASPRPISTG